MTLQQLRYTVMIADLKSMNKAAKALFVSQPALSATIKSLEEELHIEIFARNNRGIVVTPEGEQFLSYARQMMEINGLIEDRFVNNTSTQKKFSVSMQHYSFAVEAFIRLVREIGMEEYEFAVHETKTAEVISNVKTGRSEIGVLYTNDFNRKSLQKTFYDNELEYLPLFNCGIYAYISEKNPLAEKKVITFDDLKDYPCLSFEQGENNAFYMAEEVFSTYEYERTVKVDDRATMLNLMVGLNGYTLCSGIICEELNGDGYKAVPVDTEEMMEIGYIKRKKMPLSRLGKKYLSILESYRDI
ncbi:MAG: LysR family transcriptional regulator [Eubacteriales bacterium]|nr:LysR family transcriptional regulator [Eubacteriales bacterium]